jgi:hypothetical protein
MQRDTIHTISMQQYAIHTKSITIYIINNINNTNSKYKKYTINVPININNKNDMLTFLYSDNFITNMNYNIFHGSKQYDDILPESIFESSIILIQNKEF